jgi:hypothetical protein
MSCTLKHNVLPGTFESMAIKKRPDQGAGKFFFVRMP